MSKTSRNDLKDYFLTGSAPTQGQFANLIESSLNALDDKLTVVSVGTERHFGIGTDDPQSPLSVKANDSTQALVSFEIDKDHRTWDIKHIDSNEGGSGLNFGQHTGGEGQLFIRPGGNIGIGTTDPLAKLHVQDSTGACVILATDQAASAAIEQTNSDLHISTSSSTGKIIFGIGHEANTKPSTTGNPLVTINEQGNVGIGNEDPADRLQVEGGNIIVGGTESSSSNLFIAPTEIQARVGNEPQNLGLNVLGGNVGIGIDDPQAKVHIFDPTDQNLLIEGLSKPILRFAVKDKAPAEIGFKDEKTLSLNDTKLHIETADDDALALFSPGEPTLQLTIPSDDAEAQDKLGFIKLTQEALIIQSGPSDDPGVISLNGAVAFGTETPESELHIASENDDLLMLEGKDYPNLRFKNSEGQVAEIVFGVGRELSITAKEPDVLEKINLNGHVNIFSDSANSLLSVISTETTGNASDEYTTYGVFLEALASPVLKFQGSEEKKAAIEFLNGSEVSFNNGEAGDLEKYTFHGNMDVKSAGSQTGLSVATGSEAVEILANAAPGINLKSAAGTASIQFNEGTLMLAGPQNMKLTGAYINLDGEANIKENAIVNGDLEVQGSTTLDSVSVTGQVMTKLVAKEDIETKKNLISGGNVEVKKQLNVTQKATLKGAVQVDGDTTLKQTLDVAGLTSLHAGAVITGDVNVTGKLAVTKDVTFSQLLTTKDCSVNEDLQVTGQTTLDGVTKLKNGIDVTGASVLQGKLEVAGTNGEIVASKKISSGESLNSQNGVVQRDVFAQKVESDGAISLRTNIKKADARIFRLVVEGCNVSTAQGIFSELAGTSGSTIESVNHADGLNISHEYDNDDRLVIKLTPAQEGAVEAFISVSAWLPDAFDLRVTKE